MKKNKETSTSPKIPEDLGIKMGSPEEVFWTDSKKKCEESITNAKRTIEINEILLLLAEKRIKEEKETFK